MESEPNLNILDYLYQNIFTGKVRFKDSEGLEFPDWKTLKLGDIVDIRRSKRELRIVDTIPENEGKYPIFTSKGLYRLIPDYDMETEYIGLNLQGSPGNVFYCRKCSSMNSTHAYLTIKEDLNFDLKFLFYIMQGIHFNKYIQGTTIKSIKWNDLKNEKIPTPCLEEQLKISSFVDSILDSYYQLEKEIELMKLYKTYLLQNMFV